MKIDAPLFSPSLTDVRALARRQAAAGYDGLYTFDGPHDPFLPLAALAGEVDVELATGVAVAFARSPMTVAQAAQDLQRATRGRFQLGLGSQVRAHVEQRFSMPWGKPVTRMKEYVGALRAIFAAYESGDALRYEGSCYRFTMLPPMMRQGATGFGPPPIYVAGVGTAMLTAAGEVADGYVVHPFHSPAYLEQVAKPALAAGRAAAGRADARFDVVAQVLCVTGADEVELRRVREAVRLQVAFYASTPAYVPVLAAEGYEGLMEELRAMTKRGEWMLLGSRIPDALLDRLAVVGTPEEVGRALVARYRGFAARVGVGTPTPLSEDASVRLVASFREALAEG